MQVRPAICRPFETGLGNKPHTTREHTCNFSTNTYRAPVGSFWYEDEYPGRSKLYGVDQ